MAMFLFDMPQQAVAAGRRHELDLREQSLSERLAALNVFEALLHECRQRLCAQLLAIAVLERQAELRATSENRQPNGRERGIVDA